MPTATKCDPRELAQLTVEGVVLGKAPGTDGLFPIAPRPAGKLPRERRHASRSFAADGGHQRVVQNTTAVDFFLHVNRQQPVRLTYFSDDIDRFRNRVAWGACRTESLSVRMRDGVLHNFRASAFRAVLTCTALRDDAGNWRRRGAIVVRSAPHPQ